MRFENIIKAALYEKIDCGQCLNHFTFLLLSIWFLRVSIPQFVFIFVAAVGTTETGGGRERGRSAYFYFKIVS